MLAQTFGWWLVVECIGLISLPATLLLFRSLPGRGYAFAKPLSILFAGYLFWLALSTHLLPNRPGSVVWVLLLLLAVNAVLGRRYLSDFKAVVQEQRGYIIAVELVFTAAFFIAAHVRSFIPEISATEKPMDFMFLNAVSRSRHYPPEDAWLSGFEVSYYYFGYLLQAMLGKLAAVGTSVTFNLGLCSTIALAATAAFGLGYELARLLRRVTFRAAVVVGFAALVLVSVLGNLEGALEFGAANGAISQADAESIDIANLGTAKQSEACLLPLVCIKYPTEDSSFWWWWRATRISPDAGSITEFPFFSFILGDLHPHVMALPFVLTAFGLAVSMWRSRVPLSYDSWLSRWPVLLPSAVLLGGLGFLNTWDLPTLLVLCGAMVTARNLRAGEQPMTAFRDAASFMLPVAVLALVLYLPFYSSFASQASGLQAVRDEATKPLHSFLFWAPLLAVSLPLPLVRALGGGRAGASRLAWVALVPFSLLAAWLALLMLNGDSVLDAITARGLNWLTALFFASALCICLLALWRELEDQEEGDEALVPVLVATSLAVLLVLGTELFYVQDFFASRLNSVFKLYYQAWLLLGVSGAVGVYWLFDRWRPEAGSLPELGRYVWGGATALCLAAALLYPLGATLSRTQGLSRPGRTLDGLAFARANSAGDLAAAEWLRQRAGPTERLVEGVGNSYSPIGAGRISAWTGVPGVLGWPGHEAQWGRDRTLLAERERDVRTIYSSASLDEAMPLLQKYGVTYIVVGNVERTSYPAAGLQKFERGLVQVFSNGNTSVFRTPPLAPAPAEASR